MIKHNIEKSGFQHSNATICRHEVMGQLNLMLFSNQITENFYSLQTLGKYMNFNIKLIKLDGGKEKE